MTEPPTTPEPPRLDRAVPDVPAVSTLPREDASAAAVVASTLLADLLDYRERIRPAVEAPVPNGISVDDLEQVSLLRRRVGIVADALASRRLAESVTLMAELAHRIAERIAGLALDAALRAGTVSTSGETNIFGRGSLLFREMARPDDARFEQAITEATARRDLSRQTVLDMLAAPDLDEVTRDRLAIIRHAADDGRTATEIAETLATVSRDYVVELAQTHGITLRAEPVPTPAADAASAVPALLDLVENAGGLARSIDAESVAALDQALAADYARLLFQHAKFILALRADLAGRARGR